MRIVVLILTLAFASLSVLAPMVAEAQAPTPAQPARPGGAPAAAQPARPAPQASVVKKYPHGDRVESKGKGMALLSWAFAAASVGGALFVVSRRNLIAAVMGMVGSFLGIGALEAEHP